MRFLFLRLRLSSLLLLAVCLGGVILLGACGRKPAASTGGQKSHRAAASPDPGGSTPRPLPDFQVDAVATQEGMAVWYDVPEQSLPERRAWSGELTAASDTLPLDTYARVRRTGGGEHDGKTVVVRITDKGIHRPGTLIDVSREAAEALGMVSKGEVRVQVETLALKNADADKPVEGPHATPTAAKITSTPAATGEQEKNNAAGKGGG